MEVEKFISKNRIDLAIKECSEKHPFLSLYLSQICKIKIETKIRVKLLCNWCSSETLVKLWDKMSKGNFTWNNIVITWEDPADYYVIINAPPKGAYFDRKKTIVFRMEPYMQKHPERWGVWSDPKTDNFLFMGKHENGCYNNNEWHLSKSYRELCNFTPEKTELFSTILSGKYTDPGHMKRVDFVKFLERNNFSIHVFGDNRFDYKEYKGSLPPHCKDKGIFPYKYTFNVENHDIPHYFTEKLVDGILGECLVFYSGCFNVKEYIDERAFVQLSLSNFEEDLGIIKRAISEDWYTQRLPFIRKEKKKILNELQFFPRIEKIIKSRK